MGAEQSALLVCTQTGKPEAPLKLRNAEQFFQLYFDKMAEPRTGPVTEALMHLILNGPKQTLEEKRKCWTKLLEQDSGCENDEPEMDDLEERSDDEQEQDIDMTSQEGETVDDLSDSDISIESNSIKMNQQSYSNSDFEMNSMEIFNLPPIEVYHQELCKGVTDLSNEDI